LGSVRLTLYFSRDALGSTDAKFKGETKHFYMVTKPYKTIYSVSTYPGKTIKD